MTDDTQAPEAAKPPHKPPAEILAEFRERFPKAFPAEPDPPVPLAIRVHKQLTSLGYPFMAVRKALALHVGTPAYLKALAAGGVRVNLDGGPAGEVSEEHRELARAQLEAPAAKRPKTPLALAGRIDPSKQPQSKTMPQIELTAALAKIAFTIDPETFRAALDVDSVGAKAVPVAIAVDGKKYAASLNPKSFRKAQAAFREAANPVVSISGNLKGNTVEAAGIQVFDKGAKAAA